MWRPATLLVTSLSSASGHETVHLDARKADGRGEENHGPAGYGRSAMTGSPEIAATTGCRTCLGMNMHSAEEILPQFQDLAEPA
jgi:hypothetical protein